MQNKLYGGGMYPQTREQAAADAARRLGGTSRQPMQPASSYSQMQLPRQQMTQGLSSQAPLSKPLHSMYGSYLAMSPRQASSAMGMQAGAGRQRTRSSSPLSPSMQAGAFPQSSQQVADSEAMRMRAGGLGYAASSGAISGQPQPPVATQGGLVPRPVDPQQYGARPTLSPNQGRTPMSPRLADVIARSPSLQVEPYPLKSQISAAMGVTDQQVLPLTPDTAVDKYTQAMPQQSENATVVAGAAQGSRVPSVAISSGSMPYQLPVQGLPDASPQRSSGTISENSVFYPQSLRASGEQPQTTAAATQGDASQQAKQPFSAPISTGSMPYALPLRGVPEAPAPASEPISTEATPVSQAIAPEPQPNTPQPNTPQTLQSLWGANRPQEMLADSYMKMTGRADAARQYAATADAIKQGQLQDMQVMQDQREAFQAENNRIRDSLRNTQAGLAEMTERDMQRSSYAPMVNREADRLAARNDRIDAYNNARQGLEDRFDGGPIVYKGVTVNPSVAARNLSMSEGTRQRYSDSGFEVDEATGVLRRKPRESARGSGGSIGGSPEQIADQMIAGGYANEDERQAIIDRTYNARRRYGMNPSNPGSVPLGSDKAILARTDLTDQQKGIYLADRQARRVAAGRQVSPMSSAFAAGAISVNDMPGYNRGEGPMQIRDVPPPQPAQEAPQVQAPMPQQPVQEAPQPQPQAEAQVPQAAVQPQAEAPVPQAAAQPQPQAVAPQAEAPATTISDFYKQALAREQGIRNQRMANAAMRPFGLGSPPQRSRAALAARGAGFDPQMADLELRAKELELQRMESDIRRADTESDIQQQNAKLAADDRRRQQQIEQARLLAEVGVDPTIAYRELIGAQDISPYPSAEQVRNTGVKQGATPAEIDQAVRQAESMRRIDSLKQTGDQDAIKLSAISGTTLGPDATSYDKVSDFLRRAANAGYAGLTELDIPGYDSQSSSGVMPSFETLKIYADREGISLSDWNAYLDQASQPGWFSRISPAQDRINEYISIGLGTPQSDVVREIRRYRPMAG